jgi:hypothetical protein
VLGGSITGGSDLDAALPGLARAPPHLLAEHFGAPPLPRTSRSLLLRAVAYKMQERALGGLSARTRRLLSGPEPRPARRRRVLGPARGWCANGTVLRIRSGSSAPYRFIIRLWRADRFGVIASILLKSGHKDHPQLHTILDTAMTLLSAVGIAALGHGPAYQGARHLSRIAGDRHE